ncbi:PrpR N-terminal domain-containing protein [Staphylococcus simulans]|uniref:PrpR N-terminal domain-containing protein n=1 Tax=Staphylococcus simulans TaxID=1286 RepID=UPI003CE6D400
MKRKNILNILVVAPYQEMNKRIKDVKKKFKNVSITCEVGDLKKGAMLAKVNEKNYDVIISRGGTLKEIQKITNLPSVDIEISILDILRTIKMLETFEKKYVFIGYENIIKQVSILSEILQKNLDVITVDNEKEVEEAIQTIKTNGYSLVIGDMITTKKAIQNNLNSILIESGDESLEKAINEAISIGSITNKYTSILRLQRQIFESMDVHFIVLNSDNEIIYCSNNEWIEIAKKEKNQLNIFKQNYKSTYFMSHKNLFCIELLKEDNLYFIMIRQEKLQNGQLYEITQTSNDDTRQLNDFIIIGDNIKYLDSALTAKTNLCIIGENGTGKKQIKEYLFTNNLNKLCFDVSLQKSHSDYEWKELINSYDSIIYNTDTTFFISDVTKENQQRLKELLRIIDKSNLGSNQWIFFVDSTIQNESFISLLKKNPNLLTVETIPIKERKTDLSSIITLYINMFNLEYQTNIIGIEPRGMYNMKKYHWPGNFEQLRYAIEHMILDTDSSFIKKEVVEKYIYKSEKWLNKNFFTNKIPTIFEHKTLEQIKEMIIIQTLQKYDGNKTQTAESLGISRSTLWRYLR